MENTYNDISTTSFKNLAISHSLSLSPLISKINDPILNTQSPLRISFHVQSMTFEDTIVRDLEVISKTRSSIHKMSLVFQL